MKKIIVIMTVLLVILGTVVYANPTQISKKITVTGATTIQPLLEEIAENYLKEKGIEVSISGGGSGRGLSDVIEGKSDVGMVSRGIRDDEKQKVSYQTIGYDALVFIVNEHNPINEIDKATLLKIFKGEIENWKDLSNDFDESLVIVTKEIGRATLDLFEGYSGLNHLGREKQGENGYISEKNFEIAANLEGTTLVGGIPGAIGYVSLGTAIQLKDAGMPIKILELDGVEGSSETVINRTYPILRELNLVYNESNDAAKSFIEYVMNAGSQKIVEKNGFVPVGVN